MKINIDNIDRYNAAYCVWRGVCEDGIMQPHVVATLDRDDEGSISISRIELSSELIYLSENQVVLFDNASLTQSDLDAESFQSAESYAEAVADGEWFDRLAEYVAAALRNA